MDFCSDDDQVVLEDSSGRIKIKDDTKAQEFANSIVTGSIIGLLGRADCSGVFHIEDYVYAGFETVSVHA